MPTLIATRPTRSSAALVVQALVLAVAPHGGQHTARRNAWASMSRDAARAHDRPGREPKA